MRFSAMPTHTAMLTLDAFLAALRSRAAVDGILLMGSTASGKLTAASDYDLLLILADDPAAPRMVVTWVDGRFTEVYCTPVSALARIITAPTTWADASSEGAVIRWLREGRIVHDRAGRLAAAQAVAQATPPGPAAPPMGAYWAWSDISYNVAQAKRYLASDDPVYREAVDFRLLYGLNDVMQAYFTVRDLPWRGEKEAIVYWMAHDPAYLAAFRAYFAETDRGRKVARYEELARRTLAPVGILWARGTATVSAGTGWGAGANTLDTPIELAIAAAHAYWQMLTAPV